MKKACSKDNSAIPSRYDISHLRMKMWEKHHPHQTVAGWFPLHSVIFEIGRAYAMCFGFQWDRPNSKQTVDIWSQPVLMSETREDGFWSWKEGLRHEGSSLLSRNVRRAIWKSRGCKQSVPFPLWKRRRGRKGRAFYETLICHPESIVDEYVRGSGVELARPETRNFNRSYACMPSLKFRGFFCFSRGSDLQFNITWEN